MLPGRLFSCPWGARGRKARIFRESRRYRTPPGLAEVQTSPTHTAGFFSPLVALCAPRLPALGCRYVLRVRHLNTGLTPCALLCRPYGAVTGKGSPLVKSRSDEARASLAGYVTETMWYIVSTLCGGETVIYENVAQ